MAAQYLGFGHPGGTDMRAGVHPPVGSHSLGILCSVSAQTPMLGRAC